MPALAEARSPFSLLDEVERAREVLVLSYTATLEFFERFALADARALGALVTVGFDATMVLTGSPNLYAPALLRTVADGNCELALVTEDQSDLAPVEGDAPVGGVASLVRRPAEEAAAPSLVLLSATLVDGAVALQLHVPLAAAGVLQRYDLVDDRWRTSARRRQERTIGKVRRVAEPRLILALGLAGEEGPIFVRGRNSEGRAVVAVWCAPWLAIERAGPAGRWGRAWKLARGQTPGMLRWDDLPKASLDWSAGRARPREVADLLALLD